MNYIIRDIPEDLWKKVKMKCLELDVTIKGLILALLNDWVDDKKKGGKKDVK